jgi:hypothetical protein
MRATRFSASLVHKIIAVLLMTTVRSLSNGATSAANAWDGKARVAAMSTIDGAASRKAPRRVISANLPSPKSNPRAAIPEQGANSRNALSLVRGPLDLRTPDLKQAQLPSVSTNAADSDKGLHVVIAGSPQSPEERSSLAHTGIGSIYWAARNPAEAWRALLPIVPDGGSAESQDIKAECASVTPPGGQMACP